MAVSFETARVDATSPQTSKGSTATVAPRQREGAVIIGPYRPLSAKIQPTGPIRILWPLFLKAIKPR
jgi:hypothetical protein